MTGLRPSLRRTFVGAAAALMVAMSMGGAVRADPAADAMAKLTELSRQAVQSREAVTAAQLDLDAKLAAQAVADERHRADLAALDVANAELAPYQAAVDRIAAMTYMGGGTGQLTAVLTASSPQQLIDHLSLQRTVDSEMAHQMKGYREGRDRAATAATASEASSAEARAAADQATAVRADLQAKYKDLQRQIIAAEAQYASLTPSQQAAVDLASAPPPQAVPAPPVDPSIVAMPGPPSDDFFAALPVGVANEAGLQPNTVLVARAVSARFPQIGAIDGVRPDSKPWHPSGLAIDIMIPNPSSPEGIALGDEILAFAMSNAGRFGLQDVIWRGTYYTPSGPQSGGYGHYDHVHITTTPRR